jgi:DNA-binding MarR family transcriptional regulator
MRGCDEGGVMHAFSQVWSQVGTGGATRALLVVALALALAPAIALARRLAPVAVALFARLSRRELAAHPKRAALLDAIRAQPGITTAQLAARTRFAPGTLAHHLRALEKGELVKSLVVGRDRAWALAGAGRLAPMPAARARLLRLVAERPGLTQRELADAAGLAPSTVSHHVARMGERIEVERAGRTTRLFALSPREDL